MSSEVEPIRQETDMVRVRNKVRTLATQLRFSLVEQTKIVTAASEIARNTLVHGKGGTFYAEVVEKGGRRGLKLVFEDTGPGIPDMALAMTDGWTTGKGLGLGLSGSKRLVSEFHVETKVGQGTKVTLFKWN